MASASTSRSSCSTSMRRICCNWARRLAIVRTTPASNPLRTCSTMAGICSTDVMAPSYERHGARIVAMSVHPIDLSTRIIDSGVADTPPDRVTQELSELADGVALIESFSHVVVVDTGDGLVAFDSSGVQTGPAVLDALRAWSAAPVHTLVYTHGHADHVGGSRSFAADADARNRPPPRVLGHEHVERRFDRYEYTAGYNRVINMRQFGGAAVAAATARDVPFLPAGTLRP